jgi:hypothetical protein
MKATFEISIYEKIRTIAIGGRVIKISRACLLHPQEQNLHLLRRPAPHQPLTEIRKSLLESDAAPKSKLALRQSCVSIGLGNITRLERQRVALRSHIQNISEVFDQFI